VQWPLRRRIRPEDPDARAVPTADVGWDPRPTPVLADRVGSVSTGGARAGRSAVPVRRSGISTHAQPERGARRGRAILTARSS
jgi:hypothetical protein